MNMHLAGMRRRTRIGYELGHAGLIGECTSELAYGSSIVCDTWKLQMICVYQPIYTLLLGETRDKLVYTPCMRMERPTELLGMAGGQANQHYFVTSRSKGRAGEKN